LAWFQVTSELNLSETARNGISIRPFSIFPLSTVFEKLLAKLIAGLPISKVHTKESVSAILVFFVFFINDYSHGSIILWTLAQFCSQNFFATYSLQLGKRNPNG